MPKTIHWLSAIEKDSCVSVCILLEMNVNEGVEEGGGLESRNEATT